MDTILQAQRKIQESNVQKDVVKTTLALVLTGKKHQDGVGYLEHYGLLRLLLRSPIVGPANLKMVMMKTRLSYFPILEDFTL